MHGSFSEEALEQFAQLAAQTQSANFSEGDTYDFTRCVRPDGTFYGTRGQCRKGSQTGAKAAEKSKDRERNAAIEKISKERRVSPREAGSEADKIRMKELDNDIKSFQSMADKARENGFRDRAVDYSKKISKLVQERADLRTKLEKGETKANKALKAHGINEKIADGSKAAKDFRAAWQEKEKAAKAAKTELARVRAETKGDKSSEAIKRRQAAGAEMVKAEYAAFKASEKFFAAKKREGRAAMTPEQRRLEREADKLTKGG